MTLPPFMKIKLTTLQLIILQLIPILPPLMIMTGTKKPLLMSIQNKNYLNSLLLLIETRSVTSLEISPPTLKLTVFSTLLNLLVPYHNKSPTLTRILPPSSFLTSVKRSHQFLRKSVNSQNTFKLPKIAIKPVLLLASTPNNSTVENSKSSTLSALTTATVYSSSKT